MRRLAIIALLWLALPLSAQQNLPSTTGGITYEDYERRAIETMGGAVPTPPDPASGGQPPAGTRLSYIATDEMRAALGDAVYEDHIALLDYNRRVFEWQMTSTMVSFWVVIGLVLAGLVFAAIQFLRAMRAPAGDPDLTTDLEISGKGIKVSSPVLGIIILTISLGFFYLYLRHVYPIEYVRGADTAPPGAAAEP